LAGRRAVWRALGGDDDQGAAEKLAGRLGGVDDGVPAPRLVEVVGDDRLELGHGRQAALDDVVAAAAVGGNVGQPHDDEDALAVDDAPADADRVAGELDAGVRRPAPTRGFAGGGAQERTSFQVAVTGDVRIFGSPE